LDSKRTYSIVLVKKIILALLEKGPMGRTELSQTTKIHYSKLLEQLSILEQTRYVKLYVNERRISVGLADKGRDFGTKLSELETLMADPYYGSSVH